MPNSRSVRTDPGAAAEWARLRGVPGIRGHAVRAHIVTHQFVRHAHPHHTVVLVERGALVFSYRGTDWVARAGQIALVNAGELHTGRALDAEGCTYSSLAITDDMIAEAARANDVSNPAALRFGDAPVVDDQMLWWRIARMRNAVCTGAPTAEVRAYVDDALAWLVTERMTRGEPRPAARSAIRRAREHLETHYREPVSLRALGALLGWSPFQVARAFHADVGMTMHAYLEMCRVRAACTLLADGQRLSDVAYLAGFPDQAHFTRRFKGVMGLTPGAFAHDVLATMGQRSPRVMRHASSG